MSRENVIEVVCVMESEVLRKAIDGPCLNHPFSKIMSRALHATLDGLKTLDRRILYAMRGRRLIMLIMNERVA